LARAFLSPARRSISSFQEFISIYVKGPVGDIGAFD
jgi:hypothetical protein